jgi:hypothetical protein
VLAAVFAGWGIYLPVRAVRDRRDMTTVVGEVLWVKPLKDYSYRQLALADGRADSTVPWVVSERLARDVHAGDEVRVEGLPWARRVVSVEVLRQGVRRADPA